MTLPISDTSSFSDTKPLYSIVNNRKKRGRLWTSGETLHLKHIVESFKDRPHIPWDLIAKRLGNNRTIGACSSRYHNHVLKGFQKKRKREEDPKPLKIRLKLVHPQEVEPPKKRLKLKLKRLESAGTSTSHQFTNSSPSCVTDNIFSYKESPPPLSLASSSATTVTQPVDSFTALLAPSYESPSDSVPTYLRTITPEERSLSYLSHEPFTDPISMPFDFEDSSSIIPELHEPTLEEPPNDFSSLLFTKGAAPELDVLPRDDIYKIENVFSAFVQQL